LGNALRSECLARRDGVFPVRWVSLKNIYTIPYMCESVYILN
jgi:hypothetical protein